MSTRVLAAGWTTSRSFMMVAPSFEMVAAPFPSTINLSIPRGPRVVLMASTIAWQALMLEMTWRVDKETSQRQIKPGHFEIPRQNVFIEWKKWIKYLLLSLGIFCSLFENQYLWLIHVGDDSGLWKTIKLSRVPVTISHICRRWKMQEDCWNTAFKLTVVNTLTFWDSWWYIFSNCWLDRSYLHNRTDFSTKVWSWIELLFSRFTEFFRGRYGR